METIRLKSPVRIDGEEVRELACDVDAIGVEQFMEAEARVAAKAVALGSVSAKVVEFDASFHLYLGIMAVLAANPGWAVEDVERVKGPDLMKVMRVGRNFMTSGAEEGDGAASAGPGEPEGRQGDAAEGRSQKGRG